MAGGDAVFSPRLAGFVLDAFGAAAGDVAIGDDELDRLSAREREVMRLIARGYSYREVASELFISIKTVETHVSAVLRKLQLSSRHELTRWARRCSDVRLRVAAMPSSSTAVACCSRTGRRGRRGGLPRLEPARTRRRRRARGAGGAATTSSSTVGSVVVPPATVDPPAFQGSASSTGARRGELRDEADGSTDAVAWFASPRCRPPAGSWTSDSTVRRIGFDPRASGSPSTSRALLRVKQRVAAYAVIVESGRVLLPHWVEGGGRGGLFRRRIDPGEDPADAAVREVLEETGYHVELDGLLGIDSIVVPAALRLDPDEGPLHGLRIVYRAHVVGGELRDEVDGSTDTAAWFDLADLPALDRVELVDIALRMAGYAVLDDDGETTRAGGLLSLARRTGEAADPSL